MTKTNADFFTLVALSALSFTLAIALHEHGGHALACLSLGGHVAELGAFYIVCDPASLTGVSNRLVALAGPLASFLAGIVGLLLGGQTPRTNIALKYFFWLFGTMNLMIAAGYLLFSGVTGIGDFGLDAFGVFYQAQPAWLYRVGLTILGLAGYLAVILLSLRQMDAFIGGSGVERVNRAQWLSLTSYLTGGVVALLIGLLNPHGLVIVLISSVASSMGGTSGLAWMMQLLDRKKAMSEPPLVMERRWGWIAASLVIVLVYAIILGPTRYFS